MEVIYIAGPMSGKPDYNIPAFKEAARRLREAGFTVVSAIECHGSEEEMLSSTWHECMRRDVAALATQCTGIALLPGWTKSRGAKVEWRVAHSLSLTVKTLEEWLGNEDPVFKLPTLTLRS